MLVLWVSFLFFLILFIPLGLDLNYRRMGKKNNLNLKVYILFRFVGLQLSIPAERIAALRLFPARGKGEGKEAEFKPEKLKPLLNLLRDRELVTIVFKSLKITCSHFYWQTEFGFANPALTGIFNGLLWTIKGIILNLITSVLIFKKPPEVGIHPDFYHQKFKLELKGIFSVRLGNIILAVLKIFWHKLKGGIRLWENIQLKH